MDIDMDLDNRLVFSLGLPSSNLGKMFEWPPEQRLRIADALAELDDEVSIQVGSLLIEDPDPNVRARVTLKLGEIGYRVGFKPVKILASQTIGYLDRLANDPAWSVRMHVPVAALHCGVEASLPIVYRLLEDNEDEVRKAAKDCYQDLAALHPNIAAKLLIEQLDPLAIVGHSAPPSLGRFWTPRSAPNVTPSGAIHVRVLESSDDELHPYVTPAREESDDQAPEGGIAFSGRTERSYEKSDAAGGDVARDAADGAGEIADSAAAPVGGGGPGDGSPGGPPDDIPEYLDLGGESRYVNGWFVGHSNPLDPLEFGREYVLGIEVAPHPRVGTFTSGDPRFREPEFGEDAVLEVTVGIVSDDFTIHGKAARRMKLPRDRTKRSTEVSFTVTPTRNNQDVYIHVFFYHRNNLFHEALIGANVQALKQQPGTEQTASLHPVTRFHAPIQGPRDLNLQVTELPGGYRLVLFYDFGGADFDILSCTIRISRDKIIELLKGVREDLAGVVSTQGTRSDGKIGKVFFDGEPPEIPESEGRLPGLLRLDDETYQAAITRLARAGSKLYVNLFDVAGAAGEMAARALSFGQQLRALSARQPLKIQVLSDEFFIPWNLLFDGPFPSREIDPTQFWGLRHTIEEVPGGSRDKPIEPLIPVSDTSFPVGLNVTLTAIPPVLTRAQRSAFQKWRPAVNPVERFTEEQVLAAFQGDGLHTDVEYFYCHAGVGGTSDNHFDQSYLGLTRSESGLTLEDIKIATIGRSFSSRPVVFLNACESARMDGRFYDGFVPRFLGMGARAVIGSDCEVPSLFGAHFGLGFLEAFFKGMPLGEAVLAQRRELLRRFQNPLGLIYRVFGNGDARLSMPLIQTPTSEEADHAQRR